jgi:hypothetical protein
MEVGRFACSRVEPPAGFEPATCRLQVGSADRLCTVVDLQRQAPDRLTGPPVGHVFGRTNLHVGGHTPTRTPTSPGGHRRLYARRATSRRRGHGRADLHRGHSRIVMVRCCSVGCLSRSRSACTGLGIASFMRRMIPSMTTLQPCCHRATRLTRYGQTSNLSVSLRMKSF